MKKLTFLFLMALLPLMVNAQNQNSSMTAEEMYKLGLSYYKGSNGKPQNYTEAAKWYKKAAEQGHATAQNFLGVCYYNGSGVTQNYAEAMRWYRKAAEQGDAIAQTNLGSCHYNGTVVTRDYAEAFKWYSKAAEKGHATAQHNLGMCYDYGNGVTKDKTEAIKWYRKAADQGYERAKKRLAELTQNSSTAGVTAKSGNSPDSPEYLIAAGDKKMTELQNAADKEDLGTLAASGLAAFDYYKKAYATALNKNPEIVKSAQENALELYEKSQGLSLFGMAYYENKEYQKAYDAFHVSRNAFREAVLASNPQAKEAIAKYGQDSIFNDMVMKCASLALYDLKDTTAAIRELVLLKYSKLDKKEMNQVYQTLAALYYAKDDTVSYESILKEAVAKMPDETLYTVKLLSWYEVRNDYNSAIQIIDKGLAKNPNNAHLNRKKGYVLEQQGKEDEALPFYEKAIKLDPNDAMINSALGQYYYNRAYAIQGKYVDLKQYDEGLRQAMPMYEKAIPYYEKAYSLDKENKGYGYTLSALYGTKAQHLGENTPEGKRWMEKRYKIRKEIGIE